MELTWKKIRSWSKKIRWRSLLFLFVNQFQAFVRLARSKRNATNQRKTQLPEVDVRTRLVNFTADYCHVYSRYSASLPQQPHLVRAVGAGEADHQVQFVGRVFDELTLERALLRARRPRQTLVRVQRAVRRGGEGDCAPPDGLPEKIRHHSCGWDGKSRVNWDRAQRS